MFRQVAHLPCQSESVIQWNKRIEVNMDTDASKVVSNHRQMKSLKGKAKTKYGGGKWDAITSVRHGRGSHCAQHNSPPETRAWETKHACFSIKCRVSKRVCHSHPDILRNPTARLTKYWVGHSSWSCRPEEDWPFTFFRTTWSVRNPENRIQKIVREHGTHSTQLK